MAFTAKDVQALREKTNVGMMDCKKALVEADGDMDKAVEILREKGLASAAKKASRVAAEGVIGVFTDGTASALVELNCETDFVGNNPEFKALATNIAKTAVEGKINDVEALGAATISGGSVSVTDAIQELFLKVRENLKLRRVALVEGKAVSYIHGGGSVGVLVNFETAAAGDDFEAMGKNIAMQVAAMNPEYLCKESISADELAKMKSIIIDSSLNKPESLPKPILTSVFDKTIAAGKFSAEDKAAYDEQKNNKFLFNFLSKEAVEALAETAVASKDEIMTNKIFAGATEGRVAKQIKEICLLEQPFVRSDLFEGSVDGYVKSVAKTLGADIKVIGFTRFAKGEGIEKKADDFAAEIAQMVK